MFWWLSILVVPIKFVFIKKECTQQATGSRRLFLKQFCNHSVFQDAMPRALLHKDLRETSLPASFYGKLQEIGTERYSIKKNCSGRSWAAVWLFTAYDQQFYWNSTHPQVFFIDFSKYLEQSFGRAPQRNYFWLAFSLFRYSFLRKVQ